MSYIISRYDGRIYIAGIHSGMWNGRHPDGVFRMVGRLYWLDTDMPRAALPFENETVAQWWVERLKQLPIFENDAMLFAPQDLRDFAIIRLDEARQYSGHKLARAIDATRLTNPDDQDVT